MSNKRKFLKTSLLNLNKASVAWIINNQVYVIMVMYVLINSAAIIINIPMWLKLAIVIPLGFINIFYIALWLEYKNVEFKDKLEFPCFSKRFTHRLGGNVYVKPEEWQDAIVYLNYVEDFLENAGVYNKGE